jgi:hypothetical protein
MAYRQDTQDQIVSALDQALKQDSLFEAGFQILREQKNPKSAIQQEIQKMLLDELWENLCIFSQKQGKDLSCLTQWQACQWLILENHLPNATKIPIERILLIFIFALAQTTLRWEVDQLNWQDQDQDQYQDQITSQNQSKSQSKSLKEKKIQKAFQHKTSDQSDLIKLKSKAKTADQHDAQDPKNNTKDPSTKDPSTKDPSTKDPKEAKPNSKLATKPNPKSKSNENEANSEQKQSTLKAKQSQKPSAQSLGELTTVAVPAKESNALNPRSNQQNTQTPQVSENAQATGATQAIKNFTIDRKITYYPVKQQASLKKYIQSNQ